MGVPNAHMPVSAGWPKIETYSESSPDSRDNNNECAVFAEYGKNYLTPIDVIVKSSDSDTACIKARFALNIKVEEAQFVISPANDAKLATNNHTSHPILGYVPLERVISVEDSCPEKSTKEENTKGKNKEKADTTGAIGKNDIEANDDKSISDKDQEDEDELEMIVTFDCGKLSFTFKRDQTKIYVSAIKGIVKLG
jgi:hypothetical protein